MKTPANGDHIRLSKVRSGSVYRVEGRTRKHMNGEVITRINVHDKQKDDILQFSGFSPANLSQHPGFSLEVDAVAKDGQLWVMQFETIHPVRIERRGWAGASEIWLADSMSKLYEKHGWERMTSE